MLYKDIYSIHMSILDIDESALETKFDLTPS